MRAQSDRWLHKTADVPRSSPFIDVTSIDYLASHFCCEATNPNKSRVVTERTRHRMCNKKYLLTSQTCPTFACFAKYWAEFASCPLKHTVSARPCPQQWCTQQSYAQVGSLVGSLAQRLLADPVLSRRYKRKITHSPHEKTVLLSSSTTTVCSAPQEIDLIKLASGRRIGAGKCRSSESPRPSWPSSPCPNTSNVSRPPPR